MPSTIGAAAQDARVKGTCCSRHQRPADFKSGERGVGGLDVTISVTAAEGWSRTPTVSEDFNIQQKYVWWTQERCPGYRTYDTYLNSEMLLFHIVAPPASFRCRRCSRGRGSRCLLKKIKSKIKTRGEQHATNTEQMRRNNVTQGQSTQQ